MTDTIDPRAALNTAIDAARLASPLVELSDDRTFAFVPNGYTLSDITNPELLPEGISQRIEFDDRDSLTNYANRFRNERSILIADYDAGTISARLDWHVSNDGDGYVPLSPQKNEHIANMRLRDSEEYARWSDMEGKMHSQEEFAAFIEENVADVTDPEQSVLIEICRDLEATQGVSFKSGVRLENGDRSFQYQTETHVKSHISVPTEIGLSIPLYFGEAPTDIRAKFRFKPTGNGLLLGFVWHRVEYRRQATFREMAFKAAENTGLPVFLGRT